MDRVRAQGLEVSPSTLRIAENATLILPVHAALDRAREAARGERKIGTTGRGIGPAYEDKVGRRAIRVCDLAEPATLSDKLDDLAAPSQHAAAWAWRRAVRQAGAAGPAAGAGAAHPAACGAGLGAARPGAAGRDAHPVRGGAGRDARCRSWDVSVRHEQQHDCGDGCGRVGRGAGFGGVRARDREGVYDAGGVGAVPYRAERRDRAAAWDAGA